MILLKNWSVTSHGSEFTAPELRVPCLQGEVYGHSRFDNGVFIRTSMIRKIEDFGIYKIVTTNNTDYTVFKDGVDPEYEKLYPDAFDRLIMREEAR